MYHTGGGYCQEGEANHVAPGAGEAEIAAKIEEAARTIGRGGAVAGGGLGAGAQAVTHSQQIKLPSETVLNFTLQAPLTVIATTQGPNAGRPTLNTPQQQ